MKKVSLMISVLLVASLAMADYTPVTEESTVAAISVTALTAAAAEVNGDITLANDETIDNAVDAVVQVTFDDDAVVLGTVKVESENPAASISAGDEIRVDVAAQNDSSEEIIYSRIVVDLTDETTNTEDCTTEVWIQVNGTLTKVASVLAAGVTVVGDVSATTIGGVTEANIVDKSASETIAGDWTYSISPNLVNGVSGTVTNSLGGSITVVDGVITALTANP